MTIARCVCRTGDEFSEALASVSELRHLYASTPEVQRLLQSVQLTRAQALSLHSILLSRSQLVCASIFLLLDVVSGSCSPERQSLKSVRSLPFSASRMSANQN